MNASSRENGDFWTKEERDQDQDRLSLAPSRSRRWSAFRNPRIVRVSHTFGGKDRHSKVCTVRGIRDRRIRLSLPTAVRLYDLQDKLGVSQPSKVVDWLMDVTKDEIDKLPPLQMPHGFGGFPLVSPGLFGASRSSLAPFFDMSSSTSTFFKDQLIDPLQSRKDEISIDQNPESDDTACRSKYWDVSDLMRAKGKEVESRESHLQKAKFVEPNVPSRVDFLPLPTSFPHLGSQHRFMSPQSLQNPFTNYTDSIASSLSLSSSIHHNPSYYSSSTPTMPHMFPPYNNGTPHPLVVENNFQLFGSSGQALVPSLHLFGSSTSRQIMGEYVRQSSPPGK